jgi:phospholipid N-methyltransferase
MEMTDYAALAQATIGAGKRLKHLYDPNATRQMQMDASTGKSVLAELAQRREVCEMGIPGFFPTPKALARYVVERAGVEPGLRCLEPSAGTGNIALEMSKAMNNQPVCVEWNKSLFDILVRQFKNAIHADVMADEWRKQVGFEPFDRICANPPFEKNQDIHHFRRYHDLLAPGGVMACIMSEHPWVSQHTTEREFVTWLGRIGADVEQLPPGTFLASERPTGVSARLVVVTNGQIRI